MRGILLGAAVLGLLGGATAHSAVRTLPRVVLMTSVDFKRGAPEFLHGIAARQEAKMERIFRNAFALPDTPTWPSESSAGGGLTELPFEVVVMHRVTPAQVSAVLSAPNNLAVVYMAHAGFQRQGDTPIVSLRLTDYFLNSISPVFTRIHPNLRFLSLVGCTTEALQKFLKERGLLPTQGTEIQGSEGTTDAAAGLYRAIRRIQELALEPARASVCPPHSRGIPVRLVRHFQKPGAPRDALMITRADDRLLGVFPASDGSEREQSMTVWMDVSAAPTRAPALKLIADSGADPLGDRTERELGDLEISALSLSGRWERHAYPDGRAVGVTRHTYRYSGALPTLEQWPQVSREYAPFRCLY